MTRRFSLVLAFAALALVSTAAFAAQIATGDLTELIDAERVAYLRDSVCTQVSSYDRTGFNDDGFSGTYSHLRKEGEDFVIFDSQGPGCLYRLWSANPGKGWVKFYFDGEQTPRVQFKHFEDMFTDKQYPFVTPVSQTFIGGWCSYVPMPFAKSLKIVAQGPVRFFQINWHKFGTADGVKTFTPNYSQEDRMKLMRVRKAWNKLGEPPMPLPAGSQSISKSISVAPKSTVELAGLPGSGVIRALRIKASSDDTKFLRKALLLVNVDGQKAPNVYSPLGDFFLDPWEDGTAQSLLVGKASDTYYSYFVMPYARGASIKIKNESPKSVQLTYEVVYEPMKQLPKDMGRFFAWWHHQNPTVSGELFPILEAKGRGQWMGVSHAMKNPGQGLGFLEGDEMAWVDDRDNSYYNGTGTEDYFNGGWYFRTPGSAALYGCGDLKGDECHAYRLHLTDMVPFQKQARIGIEHGRESKTAADYAGVTYWYAAPGTSHTFTQTPLAARINRPGPVKGVTEAERLAMPGKGKLINDMNYEFYLSSGEGVIGQELELTIDAPEAGPYQLELGFLKGPMYGIADVSIDGKVIAKDVDTYAEKIVMRDRTWIGMTPELAKGKHQLTVRSTGKNTASTGSSVLVDFVILRSDLDYEAERLQPSPETAQNKKVTRPTGFMFSGGQHLQMASDNPGDTFSFIVPIRKAGKYPVSATVVRGRRYGIFQVKVDGKPLGEPVDGFITRALPPEPTKFGDVELTAGEHEITFEVVGKGKEAMNCNIGIDTFSLR